jgi:MFS family permease
MANMPTAMIVNAYLGVNILFILCAILGSWSDRNGRQLNILLGNAALMIGYTFAQSILYS